MVAKDMPLIPFTVIFLGVPVRTASLSIKLLLSSPDFVPSGRITLPVVSSVVLCL